MSNTEKNPEYVYEPLTPVKHIPLSEMVKKLTALREELRSGLLLPEQIDAVQLEIQILEESQH